MIKAFILYFLSIKSTHGYEIQKYIELNHMNDWTKIQSGSIYYALAKLEKEQFIQLEKTETIKNKTRKIYSITQAGRDELENLLIEELNKPIYNEKSDKFVAYPYICSINRNLLESTISSHIKELEDKKKNVRKWQEIKLSNNSLQIEKISFDMMLSSLTHQISWHRALLQEIDTILSKGDVITELINDINFANINSINELLPLVDEKLN